MKAIIIHGCVRTQIETYDSFYFCKTLSLSITNIITSSSYPLNSHIKASAVHADAPTWLINEVSFREEKQRNTKKKMDWNGTFRQESSLDFLYNYNFDQYTGFAEAGNYGLVEAMKNDKNENKKKKLTREQLDTLERSFQEEIKLDPDRKMRLSMELGLQARQVAVWFQNRRARWKAKRLEHSYHMLKQHYDVIYREKQMLQHEVMKLKGMLMERGTRNYTDISGEVADENTSICRWSEPMIAKNYYLDMDEYYPVSTLDVGAQLPSYHH